MKKTSFLLTLSSLTLTSALSAQILVTESSSGYNGDGGIAGATQPRLADETDLAGTTIATDWSLTGGNTVAVYFGAEQAAAGTFAATFGGQAMNIVTIGGVGNNHMAAIGYLINPTASTGDVVIQADQSGVSGQRLSYAWGVLSLSNVGSVAGSDTGSGTGGFDVSYTVGSKGSFVLGNAVNNSFNYSSPPSITGNPDTTLFGGAFDGNSSGLFSYGDTAAGSFDDSYGNAEAGATLAFQAVPEPSAFALLAGCLGLASVMLRRRR